MTTRIEVNCTTGEVRQIPLTQGEIDAAAAATAAEAISIAGRERELKRKEAVRALEDELLAKRALDPDAPREVKDYAEVTLDIASF